MSSFLVNTKRENLYSRPKFETLLKSIFYFLVLLSAFLFLGSCGSPKTEREQYEEASSGVMYATYKGASKVLITTTVESYNLRTPDSLHLEPMYAHLLLGYFWSISHKPSLAFAEAEITEENNETDLKYLAQSLRSITMYQEGWHDLAKEESINAKVHLAKKPGTSVSYEASVFYLIMGSVYVKEKDFAQAKFFWAGFGNESGIQWPYLLCDAAADIQGGNVQLGLKKIKVIAQDPAVPLPLREALTIQLEKIEKQAGASVDSSLFWPTLIAKLLWEELKTSTDGALHTLAHLVDSAREKLPH